MSRTTYPAGSGYFAWNSLTWNLSSDFTTEEDFSLFKRPSATRGESADSRIGDAMVKISAEPKLFLTGLSSQLAALWPYTTIDGTSGLGSQVYPASDLPLVINFRDGKVLTSGGAAVTKMPVMNFSPLKPLAGPVEWTALVADGSVLGDTSALLAPSTASYTEPTWDPSDELLDTYTLALGRTTSLAAAALTNGSAAGTCTSTDGLMVGQAITGTGIPASTTIAAVTSATGFTLSANATATNTGLTLSLTARTIEVDKDGITFTPTVTLEPVRPAMRTTNNMRIAGLTGVLEFRPLAMDVADVYALLPNQGFGVGLGTSQRKRGVKATVTGSASGSALLTIPKVVRASATTLAASNKEPRAGKVQLEAMLVSGSSLFTIATV
jgi:hypothetical protein